MKGYIRHESGALIREQTPEELEQTRIKKLVLAIYEVLPEDLKSKLDPQLVEVIK